MYYDRKKKEIALDGPNPREDYVLINERDKFIDYLDEWKNTGKGGNSFIFKVVDCNEEETDQIIKLCKYFQTTNPTPFINKRINRFEREIKALLIAQELEKNDFLVNILAEGWLEVSKKKFRYYVMEKAHYDLSIFLADNNLSLQSKIELCYELIGAFKALHEIGIYHRDIKPDNIFFIGNKWKIGDLGLIKFRDEDIDIDDPREKIGPYGLLSPEAANKALGNKELESFIFDCEIDNKSDVFQLGALIWYILQGEIPTGQLILDDFRNPDSIEMFYNVIFPSLQFAKSRRPDINELYSNIIPICKDFALI